MKKITKILTIISLIVVLTLTFCFVSCTNKNDDSNPDPETNTDNNTTDNSEMPSIKTTTLRFTAPEGTPALAMLRLPTDNTKIAGYNMEYAVVNPSNIAAEMSSKKSDIVIMPVNAGANLIRQGADYKLVSIAVNGSLFMVGKGESNTITINDIKGKKIACIGQTGVPGLIFRYVMSKNGLTVITEGDPDATKNEVFVQYVKDGQTAKASSGNVDYAVVGEPAATALFKKDGYNAEMNMQEAYAAVSETGITNYPQAGLFVKSSLANDTEFMSALMTALKTSKEWVIANKTEVTAFAKENLYESAAFPAAAIGRCALNCEALTDASKTEILAFLKAVAGKDGSGNSIDWDSYAGKLF